MFLRACWPGSGPVRRGFPFLPGFEWERKIGGNHGGGSGGDSGSGDGGGRHGGGSGDGGGATSRKVAA